MVRSVGHPAARQHEQTPCLSFQQHTVDIPEVYRLASRSLGFRGLMRRSRSLLQSLENSVYAKVLDTLIVPRRKKCLFSPYKRIRANTGVGTLAEEHSYSEQFEIGREVNKSDEKA